MKTRHAVILVILVLGLDIIGALFKILHLPGADEILIFAIIFQVGGGLFFLVKFLNTPRVK